MLFSSMEQVGWLLFILHDAITLTFGMDENQKASQVLSDQQRRCALRNAFVIWKI
jgi:hypothetical protein